MNNAKHENEKPPSAPPLPRWLGAIWCGAGIPLAHGLLPWALSLLSVHHGWLAHHPGAWNWLGLIFVAMGLAGVVWGLVPHFTAAPQGWQFELTPQYLLRRGPYRFSRNPIYLAYGPLWLGWIVFYGSAALLLTCVVGWFFVNSVLIPSEERKLEARFGEAYRDYKRTVPRWLGRVRR